MANDRILIVEDDDLMQGMLKDSLKSEGLDFELAGDGMEGWKKFREEEFWLVITDLRLPGMDGISLLKKIMEERPGTTVILMTAYGSIENAVEAVKLGAADYISKPFLKEDLLMRIKRAGEMRRLRLENTILQQELGQRHSLASIIGKSKPMQEIYRLVETVADSTATVLVQGESGTGKELIAEAIHHLGPRKNKPLIKVSCAILTETLLESELFGHEKGSFTDAISKKIGRFELADSGTIFLDDIDDMAPKIQVKLLRVLQERTIERVGGNVTLKVDCRVIAATKKNLLDKVKDGSFREDLYYRLNVIPVLLPPLRERSEDIPLLIEHFVKKFNKKNEKHIKISPEAVNAMMSYHWPGNIRELENIVERVCVLSEKGEILKSDLPANLFSTRNWTATALHSVVIEAEKEHILRVLETTGGKKKEAAELLGITPKTLWQKMKQYELNSD